MDETNIRSSLNLTRIRLQLAIYFLLHGGSLPEKHCKLASEIDADNLKKAGWTWGCVSAVHRHSSLPELVRL